MFDFLKNLFGGGEAAGSSTGEIRPETAAAALMVEAALADGVYANVEEARIAGILEKAFELGADEARTVLEEAEDLAERAVDHHRFTRVVKHLPREKRVALMEHLWAVALADGERDHAEDSLLRRLGPLLAISDRERAEARQRAEAREH